MKNLIAERLNYLIILSEEKNITRAAERLYISQPALTAYLNRLEADLNIKLFDRTTSPIRITPAGSYYISELEKINAQYTQLHNDLQYTTANPDLKLNIGIGRNRGFIWLPQILPPLYQRHPQMQLNVTESRDTNMTDMVTHGILDVAIVENYTHMTTLSCLDLPCEYHLIMANPDNPVLRGVNLSENNARHPAAVKAETLATQLFICPDVNGSLNHYTSWMFSTYNFHPQRILKVSNDLTSYRLVTEGVGIAFLNAAYPSFVQTGKPPVYIMPDGKPTERNLYLIYNNTVEPTELMRDFIDVTSKVMLFSHTGQITPRRKRGKKSPNPY